MRLLLERQPDFAVVGETEDGRQTVDAVDEQKPDVVVMEIAVPNLNGIEATRQIVSKLPDTSVVILSMHPDESYVLRALKTGSARLSAERQYVAAPSHREQEPEAPRR